MSPKSNPLQGVVYMFFLCKSLWKGRIYLCSPLGPTVASSPGVTPLQLRLVRVKPINRCLCSLATLYIVNCGSGVSPTLCCISPSLFELSSFFILPPPGCVMIPISFLLNLFDFYFLYYLCFLSKCVNLFVWLIC